MSEKGFTRWNELLKEVHTKKLNSAERMKEKNNISVSADHPKGAAAPNKSVISSENEPRQIIRAGTDEKGQ